MLSEKDLSQVQNYLIEILPQLLRQQPEIATTVKAIVNQQLPEQSENARILEEIKLLREDTNRHFQQVERRIELVEHGFEQVERRMEQVEQRIEQVERRIELLEQQINQRFNEQHKELIDLKRRMIKVESTVERTNEKITKFDAWLKIVTGNVGEEKGQALEQLFALGLSYGLKNRDILPETIQLRQQFEDTEGLVYLRKGKFIEVDIIAENGKFTVFEVKASAVGMDVDQFARKVKLIQLQNPDKQVHSIFISPGAKEEVKQCCMEYEIELLN
jgi:hypothetical protein